MKQNDELLNSETNDIQLCTEVDEIEELPSPENSEQVQYEYLKNLNKKLIMFKKHENKSEEQAEQTRR